MCPLVSQKLEYGYVKNQDITDITILQEVVGNEEGLEEGWDAID